MKNPYARGWRPKKGMWNAAPSDALRGSELKRVERLFRPEAPQRMAAQREPKALVDQVGQPVVLEREEGPDAEFAPDSVGLARVAAHEIRQRDRLGHPDRSGV